MNDDELKVTDDSSIEVADDSFEDTQEVLSGVPTEVKLMAKCLAKLVSCTHEGKKVGSGTLSLSVFLSQLNKHQYTDHNNENQQSSLSENTLRKYIKAGYNDNYTSMTSALETTVAGVTRFLKLKYGHEWAVTQSEMDFELIDTSTPKGRLVYGLSQEFSSDSGTQRYGSLQFLNGTFACYRRTWVSGFSDHIQRSLVKVEFDGFWKFSETQIGAFGGHKVDELNHGPILPFGSNFFALIRSRSVLKMLGISNFYPEPESGRNVELFYGYGQGISGKGPHPGYPFVCSRIDGASHVADDKDQLEARRQFLALVEKQVRSLPERVWDEVHAGFDPFGEGSGIHLANGNPVPTDVLQDRYAPQCIRILRQMEQGQRISH